MSAAFGPGAARLAGLAGRLLGWRPGDFWHATPADLAAAFTPFAAPEALTRADLTRLMEHDHDRRG